MRKKETKIKSVHCSLLNKACTFEITTFLLGPEGKESQPSKKCLTPLDREECKNCSYK
jgi:hypothetical protein